MDLNRRVALVTGAGGGIGRATASTLAEHGAIVVGVDIDPTSAKQTVAEIERSGGQAVWQHCDVTSPDDVADAVGLALARFGRLDVICNIAGIGGDNQWLSDEDSDWREVIEVDPRVPRGVVGVISGVRAREDRPGCIFSRLQRQVSG